MPHPQAKVHRMFELVEPIATVTFSEVPNEAFLALGAFFLVSLAALPWLRPRDATSGRCAVSPGGRGASC